MIKEFCDWCCNHPVFLFQKEKGDIEILGNYGLWFFCAKCKYQFQGSILQAMFVTEALDMKVVHIHTLASERELRGLQEGRCPACGNTDAAGLMTGVPTYVEEAFGPKK